MMGGLTNLELRSLITRGGVLKLSLARNEAAAPGPDEVLVEMQAAPINPSDLGLLVGAADVSTAVAQGEGVERTLSAQVPAAAMPYMEGRLDQSYVVGNEGAGMVVRAGASPGAQALIGRLVAVRSGSTYARYVLARVADCFPLPEGATAAEGASAFVNPMTALALVETMRAEGHTALVHTAAASNLGQMLNRVCLADHVPLVNVVRSRAQAAILQDTGALHVCDSSQADFMDALVSALKSTGATIAFDAIGGGRLASNLLQAMATVASAGQTYSRYGSSGRKQVYIYGALDLGATVPTRSFGLSWSLGGWLLTNFLGSAPLEVRERMQTRIAAELKTTFASQYTRTLSLSEALDREVFWAYLRRATGEKYLVDPSKDV